LANVKIKNYPYVLHKLVRRRQLLFLRWEKEKSLLWQLKIVRRKIQSQYQSIDLVENLWDFRFPDDWVWIKKTIFRGEHPKLKKWTSCNS
jgi:hypothetical protein